MLRIGLNPYGLAYTVGLQGAGTPRANPAPIGIRGFIALAREIGAQCIELHGEWLRPLRDAELEGLRDELGAAGLPPIVSAGLTQQAGETLAGPIRAAARIGARLVRLHLSPVLEGARARWGERWGAMVRHAEATLGVEARRAGDAGLSLGIENHQDFGSEELVAMAESAGPNVGVVFDTGNPFSVGEDPVAFARRAAHRIVHVHLKDYRAQFTGEGYRLVRCAIGEGAVPFNELVDILLNRHGERAAASEPRARSGDHGAPAGARVGRAAGATPPGSTKMTLTASIEPGALEARHVRLFTREWWQGYPPRDAAELAEAIGRLRGAQLAPGEPYTTPWEQGAGADDIVAYETAQVRKSMENMTRWMQATR